MNGSWAVFLSIVWLVLCVTGPVPDKGKLWVKAVTVVAASILGLWALGLLGVLPRWMH